MSEQTEILDGAAMSKEAVPFYQENPSATMRESYEWLGERYTLSIKLKTWTNGHATRAMVLAQPPDRPKDMNQLAKRVVEIATGEAENDSPEMAVVEIEEPEPPAVEPVAPMPREPLTFEFGDKKLRAVPVNDGGTQWHVEFDGVISDFALNMLMADIWDRVLERQVDGDGGQGEWPLRGSMIEKIESSISSLDRKVEWALERAGIEL